MTVAALPALEYVMLQAVSSDRMRLVSLAGTPATSLSRQVVDSCSTGARGNLAGRPGCRRRRAGEGEKQCTE